MMIVRFSIILMQVVSPHLHPNCSKLLCVAGAARIDFHAVVSARPTMSKIEEEAAPKDASATGHKETVGTGRAAQLVALLRCTNSLARLPAGDSAIQSCHRWYAAVWARHAAVVL